MNTCAGKLEGDKPEPYSGLFISYNLIVIYWYSNNLLFELFHDALV